MPKAKCQAHMHRDAAHIGTLPSRNEHLGICGLHDHRYLCKRLLQAFFPTLPRILAAASSELIPSSACGDPDTDARGVDASGGVQSCSSSETFHDLGPVYSGCNSYGSRGCVPPRPNCGKCFSTYPLNLSRAFQGNRGRSGPSVSRQQAAVGSERFKLSRQQGAVGSERFKAAGGGRVRRAFQAFSRQQGPSVSRQQGAVGRGPSVSSITLGCYPCFRVRQILGAL